MERLLLYKIINAPICFKEWCFIKKQIEKILVLCDNHHIAILNTNLIVFALATIILFCFNGNQVSFEFCIFVTVFPLVFFLSGYYQSKICSENNKRILTLIFLTYLFVSITVLIGYIWCCFVKELSGIEAFFFTIPLIIFAAITGAKVFPQVGKKIKYDIKFMIKCFFNK